ncbi:MAG TPA: HEAT repeat domain-containing protein, partial [Polyangiaceae bacterium]|nr:HEAT repeat domain-containing protein [Polyangiaceae bacterium]
PIPKLPFSADPTPAPAPRSLPSAQRLQLVSEPDDDVDDHDDDDVGDDFVGELTDDDVDSAWGSDLEGIPASRTESHSAVPLARPAHSSELKLPSVIVDLANDCRMLLDQLLAGDESAGDRLVEIGTTAVTVLVSAFPGPLKPRSMRPGGEVPKASDSGPVLRMLKRLGHKSAPFVAVRTNDTDPGVRHWATLLLGELPAPESVHAVARRFFDTDEDVRRAALTAAKMFLEHPEYGRVFVGEFGSIAQDANKGSGMRLAAIDALAELRHPLCVPELVHVLPLGPNEVTQAASRALCVVTRQDFGTDGAMWAEWWRANGGRHRIEWLIDSLTHDAQDIRRPAGEELKALTREYFGYYDDLPPRERERAQMRYREWWETRGKARFH